MASTVSTGLTFTVDDDLFIRAMSSVTSALEKAVDYIARALEEDVRSEAGQRSRQLGEPWDIEGVGSERHVVAPQWWAHFLAHGTKDHGPAKAEHLVFEIAGDTISTDFVRGVPADPFDERAVERARAQVGYIIGRLIEGAL